MKSLHNSRGFSLVEVAIALAVCAFCLITLLALFPVGLTSSRNSSEETLANGILETTSADLRATGVTCPAGQAASSPQFAIAIPASGSTGTTTLYFSADGSISSTLNGGSSFRLAVVFPTTAGGKAATQALLEVSWPAAAANPSNFVKTFVALDRN